MEQTTTIIEINGVKMEVDLRKAKIVHDNLRVGSRVKILVKSSYGSPEVYPGIVAGFEMFPSLPTITVAYLTGGYESSGLNFAAVNAKTADKYEIVPSIDDDLPVKKGDVLQRIEREIEKKRADIADLESKRAFFLRHFDEYFVNVETV